jgi:hypothetical protein
MVGSQEVVGFALTLLLAIIIASVTIQSVATDALIGSTTSAVNPLFTLLYVVFTIAGIGMIALVGKWIISIFA